MIIKVKNYDFQREQEQQPRPSSSRWICFGLTSLRCLLSVVLLSLPLVVNEVHLTDCCRTVATKEAERERERTGTPLLTIIALQTLVILHLIGIDALACEITIMITIDTNQSNQINNTEWRGKGGRRGRANHSSLCGMERTGTTNSS